MFFKQLLILFTILSSLSSSSSSSLSSNPNDHDVSFIFNGFRPADVALDGIADVTPKGLLRLTNETKQRFGHAYFPDPILFVRNDVVSSFSTEFVFAIRSEFARLSGHGIAFVVSPSRGLPGALPSQYLGLFNESNDGNATNQVVAVELDTIQSKEFNDIDDNHVGVDINSLKSIRSSTAGFYYDKNNRNKNDNNNKNDVSNFRNLTLISGSPMRVWVEYDAAATRIDVVLAPVNSAKPETPLVSVVYDLSKVLNEKMYVGFSSATGSVLTSHYVLGWSFKVNGQAQGLEISKLPRLPRIGPKPKSKLLTIGLPILSLALASSVILVVILYVKRKRKFAEIVEDWELEYGPQRFKYKDLYLATKGFKEKEILGSGGFGRVFKGSLLSTKSEIAVKRVSHNSRQGMREFVAEIVSLGRLRHRNLVPLLGYCRRSQGELLLVYEFMPNGSLDKYLYDRPELTLTWRQRFKVVKGVALGLYYLHEEWEQVVIHRDVKASNVLLDAELNGRLGDFGLARLYDHGTDPGTTHVVGTLGYLAPEHTRTGKATTKTDVFAFGAFLLEVACGRRPIERRGEMEDVILVDWVFSWWSLGRIVEARDRNPGIDFGAEELEEVELVLKLGLLCSHSEPTARPSMRQVVQYLERDVALPDLSMLGLCTIGLTFSSAPEGFDDFAFSYPSSAMTKTPFSLTSSNVAESLLSNGR